MKNPHVLRGYACASGGAIIWGLSGTAGQYLLSHYDAGPLLISNLRLLIGGVLLLAFAARQHRAIRDSSYTIEKTWYSWSVMPFSGYS